MSLPRLALALVLPLTLAAPARASQMTDATPEQIEALLAKLSRMPINARVDVLSKFFVGTPYADFPLGEGGSGPEPQARFRLDAVDCQTFVETVLALANSKSIEQAKLVLDDIRYSRLPASFATRNHFTEAQWLPSNIEKGYLREAVGAIDGHAPETSLVLKRAEWSQIEGLKRLESAEIPEGKFPIKYLPINDFKKRSKSIETGSIILVVREADRHRVVRVSHMAIAIQGDHGLELRHAASGARQVVDEPLDAYLSRITAFKKWKVIGFGVAAPLDAKVRAAAFSKSEAAQ